MIAVKFALFALFTRVVVGEMTLPFGIKKCKMDESFSKCVLEQGATVIPRIVEGDKDFHIPSLTKFKIPILRLNAGDKFALNFTDMEVVGLAKAVMNDFRVHFDKSETAGQYFIPEISIKGTYSIDGKILILPIKGEGPGEIKFLNGNYTFKMKWNMYEKKGVKYGKPVAVDVQLKAEKVIWTFENLFNGDAKLGNEMNKFLNENWEDVLADFSPVIRSTVSQIIFNIAEKLFNRIPYDEFFAH